MFNEREEKRKFPRIKANKQVKIVPGGKADSVNLSEAGVSFVSEKQITASPVALEILFFESNFKLKTDAHIIWEKPLANDSFLYGVAFFSIDKEQATELRKALIKTHINGLLLEITDQRIKEDVTHFFMTDVFWYIDSLLDAASRISEEHEYDFTLNKELEKLNNEIILKGYCLEELAGNKLITDKVKADFRLLIGTWAYKSLILKRGFEKPRGYPGDYLLLEALYNNECFSRDIGMYFDKFFLSSPFVIAIRQRKDRLLDILKQEIERSSSSTLKIMAVGCGSCREIKELPAQIFAEKSAVFTCLDRDEKALDFSRHMIKELPEHIKINLLNEDAFKMIQEGGTPCEFEKQGLIYSIALLDYLPAETAKAFLRYFYDLLLPKGKLVLTHKNKEKTFSPIAPDWFCDWKLVARNKEEATALFYACGIKDFSLVTRTDDFNEIFYFTLTKH